MIRDILAHRKVDTALGAAFVTVCVIVTIWIVVALLAGSIVLLRDIEEVIR